MNELFLASFFSLDTDRALNKMFYSGDAKCEQQTLEYVQKIISTPLADFVAYLKKNPQSVYVTSEHITQCSHIELCHIELCEAFKRAGYKGLTLFEIGEYLHNDGIVRSRGTESKYGENVKGAKQFGLAYFKQGLWYLSAIGAVFSKLNDKDRLALLARNLMREPLYIQIFTEAVEKEVYLSDYMHTLTDSTIKRRTSSVMAYCNVVVKQSQLEEEPMFYQINR